MLKISRRINWRIGILSAIIIVAFILFPVRLLYVHNHHLDGGRHPDCPVNKYLASYFADGAVVSVDFTILSHFTMRYIPETRRLRLVLCLDPADQRAPPHSNR
jgi:hypothetical protein